MFSLKISDLDVSGGTVPVSWCLDMETINRLQTYGAIDPQVVIVVAPEGDKYSIKKEYRKVVPLKDLMAYIEFRSVGPNRIWAFIDSLRDHKMAKNRWLYKEGGEYGSSILTYDGNDWGSYISLE